MIIIGISLLLLGFTLGLMVYDGTLHEWKADSRLVIALAGALLLFAFGCADYVIQGVAAGLMLK